MSGFRPRHMGGFSVLETVISFFVITVAVMGAARMIDSSAHISSMVISESVAVEFAVSRVREIQVWARGRSSTTGVRNYRSPFWPDGISDLEVQDGVNDDVIPPPGGQSPPTAEVPAAPFARTTVQAPVPDLEIEARAWRYRVHSPSRGARDSFFLDGVMRVVEVRSMWGDDRPDGNRARELSLVAFVPAPPPEGLPFPASVAFTRPSGSLRAKDSFTTAARVVGPGGAPYFLEDMVFQFHLVPITGNAEIQRVGAAQARITNHYLNPQGGETVVPGRVRVQAGTYLWGEAVWGESEPFDLGGS